MDQQAKTTPKLEIRRTFAAPAVEIFRAWTEPALLRKWWGQSDEFTTPIAEVDLRVGGRYRLGMQPPESTEVYIVGGEFREIQPPHRLVFTWQWEPASQGAASMLVTIELVERSAQTELILIHELLPDEESREQHAVGWALCLGQLEKLFPITNGR